MPDPNLRAADSDRSAVAEQLGRHLSDGRLTVDEYDERLAKAYTARTYGELDELLADLPSATPAPQPAARPTPSPATASAHRVRYSGAYRAAWGSWVSVAIIVTAIWAFSTLGSGNHGFWPIWVIGPWGAVLLARTVSGRPYPGSGRCSSGHRRGW